MDSQTVLKELAKANHHKGGLKCLRLFKVQDDFFAKLRTEIKEIIERNEPSEVKYKGHVTNWTKPFGRAIQFSLLNVSGKYDDTSADHSMTLKDKKFHHEEQYPSIAAFIKAFPHAYNMRLNGMGPAPDYLPMKNILCCRRKKGF